MKRIITVIGARPQFVKAATVSREFKLLGIDEKIIHTGQHYDANMSDLFFEEMNIPQPCYNLNIHGLSHGAMTGRMLEKIEEILIKERPDGVLVYGDTNSTLAGALAAAKLNIPVIHVEAGLRSFNTGMPEEINRVLTDRISKFLFCPTDAAVENLNKEGFRSLPVEIYQCGDVMQDAALFYGSKAENESTILNQIGLQEFVLATVHRQENTDNPKNLRNIIQGLNAMNRLIPVVVPIHPRTKEMLNQLQIVPEFKLIEPVGYLDMIMLLKSCKMVVTDSGGLQKEAFFFGKNCITLREQTEWVELVQNGFNILVGSDSNRLMEAFEFLKAKQSDFNIDFYGNGQAAKIIAETIYRI